MKKKRVCVFGSYKDLGRLKRLEFMKFGGLLAKAGFEVITGGFGGTMEDISRGAKLSGGRTIGVTYYKRKGPSGKRPNRYVDKEIRTRDVFERIKLMMKLSDVFCVLPGGTGTLLELAACLECINKGLMPPKPVFFLGNFWEPVLRRLAGEELLSEKARLALKAVTCKGLFVFAGTKEELIRKIKELPGSN